MILPFVRELFADAEQSASFARAVSLLKTRDTPSGAGAGRISVSGLTPTAQAWHLPLLQRAIARPLAVITSDNRAAERLLPLVRAFCGLTGALDPARALLLPAHDVLPFENLSPHPEIEEERASALWKIASGGAGIVVVPAAAAALRLRPAEHYAALARVLRRSESIEADALLAHLNTVGYARTDLVEMPGEYALRGGLLDVYPPEAERPARVEFFGDEIESIRSFDPATQRSLDEREEIALLPLTETPATEENLAGIHARLARRRVAGSGDAISAAAASGGVFPGWELYAGLAHAGLADGNVQFNIFSVFDLLSGCAVMVEEPAAVTRELDAFWEKVAGAHRRSRLGDLIRPEELYAAPDELLTAIAKLPGGSLEELAVETSTDNDRSVTFLSQPTPRFHGAMPALAEEVKKLADAGRSILFAVPNQGEVERLAEIFTEYDLPYRLGSRTPRSGESYSDSGQYFSGDIASVTLVRAAVPEGVALPDASLVLFGALDLFDESEAVVARPLAAKSKVAAFLSDFRDLAAGDFVVHVEHGIGRYLGLKEITQSEAESAAEFMLLEYADEAKLYVPLTRLDLVQKYRSAEGGGPPQLARLGSGQWARTKAKVKKAMREMADELLRLYAARKTAEGHSFPADTPWQKEFDDAFEHSETDDQEQAIVDVKRDMESGQPMDRLLCGDVGYGKTEVAMRAAFKCVCDNRQVAILAPTTVLAFQHFETFKQRFAAFPIRIEMLSRFRTPKQQKEIVARVEAGKVDVLIGTHRLLSRDLKFHDLGLLVVDEEQRFGVRHKERLKQLKKEVDVLTLSATPIPRTLHMSLVGLRDMSLIETPPRDRMAIQTVVAAFDEKLVRNAIEQELERGGQTFFVHNRVDSIYEMAAKVQEMVPRARLLVGHGQMSEGELEKVMLKFMRHEADVLVATTIIENGLDIPLCNTILINRADRHGLSELYQLRGRVGRSARRAYAYLLVPAEQELTPLARRRLAALKEFSDLGSGFKIAALDLELRGAGNLLGGEQSGHIDAVGFELYTSLLERTVRELKGEAAPEEAEAQLNLGVNIRIPPEYIAEENQRLRMYKRIAGVENEEQLADARAEVSDRYGPPPAAVARLIEYAALRLLCRRVGVSAIERRRDQVTVRFNEKAAIDPEPLAQLVSRQRGAQFSTAGVLKLPWPAPLDETPARLHALLEELSAAAAGATAK